MAAYTHASPMAHSIPDACALLGISRSTMWNLSKEGKIRLVRIGRRTLVPRTELIRLVEPK